MTRKQVDEVEKNVAGAQNKFDRNKDKLERINKVLVNAKSGIEHLCDKLTDIKLENMPNIVVTDNSLVEALIQAEQKCNTIYAEVKSDPHYEEVMNRIKGLKIERDEKEYVEPNSHNLRVKLPDKDDEELSDVEMEGDTEQDVNERMKIKVEA